MSRRAEGSDYTGRSDCRLVPCTNIYVWVNSVPRNTALSDGLPVMGDHIPRSTIRVLISGRVQGVWYRGWTVGEARAVGLDGWVRNRSDGKVEAVFSGPLDRVEAMIDACRVGPPAARVTSIECFDDADPPSHSGFRQRPTL